MDIYLYIFGVFVVFCIKLCKVSLVISNHFNRKKSKKKKKHIYILCGRHFMTLLKNCDTKDVMNIIVNSY